MASGLKFVRVRLALSSLLTGLAVTLCAARYPQITVRADATTARADGVATIDIIATMTHDDGTPFGSNIVMFSVRDVGRLSEATRITADAGIATTKLSSGMVTVTAYVPFGVESPEVKDTTTVTFSEL